MIPDAAEVMRSALTEILEDEDHYFTADWTPELAVESAVDALLAYIQSILPHIQAQTLVDAVHAFPLETIHAPDNAVVWMMRRADELREGASQ